MIRSIVDYKVGICPFNVNKCGVTDTLLLYGATELSCNLRNASNDRPVERDVAGITARTSTTSFRKLWKRIK